jgi:hypothetical protein
MTLWQRFKQRALCAIDLFICVTRKMWRPVTCWGVAGGVWVYCFVTPLYSLIKLGHLPADGVGIAAVIASATAAFAVREAGKIMGSINEES